MSTQWIADLNLDHLSRFDSYMRAKVRQLYISLFHAYARKNNMWILDHGEALLKVDPLQPALRTGLIHCACCYGALNSMILRFWPPLSINVKVTYTY